MPFPTYDKKADIPAGAEDVYEEKDGKFVPKLPDVTTLETTLGKVRDEKKAAEKALKDAETARDTATRELDALKTQSGDSAGKVAELLKKWDTEKAELEAKYKGEIESRDKKLRGLTLDQAAKDAFIKAGGRPERADAALRLAAERIDLADDRPVVKDAKGNVTTATLEDFFKADFRKDMPELYTGSKAGGGGAGGINNGGAGGIAPTAEQIMANPGLAFEASNAAAQTTT